MPEFRTDPVTGHRVIIAPDRALRPDQADGLPGPCVFCPGQEAETPPEVARLPGPAGTWRARVVPNKYPAIDATSGGAHEVVIESARHATSFLDLSQEEVAGVLGLWQARIRALGGRVVVFKNEGAAAGASIEHVHSQVVALREAPSIATSPCAICADVDPARAIEERGGFLARVPLAPRFAHEVRLAPASHRLRFEEEVEGSLGDLAGLLLEILRRLRSLLGRFPYNLVLQNAAGAHWRLEILPRTSRPGGFEWGTGTFINTAAPEVSAELLRKARA